MTYCIGILVGEGLVFAADTLTNAGVDHLSTFRKMTVFERPSDRILVLLTAGNLATSQAVVSLVSERLGARKGQDSLFKTTTMFNAARIVGGALREVIRTDGEHVKAYNGDASASFIFGGQIRGRPPRLFQIYPAGNFIEASPETPFFQIGETKYGKPILDRVTAFDMPLLRAAKGALLSFDSTMRSNLSVGEPIDLLCYRGDSLKIELRHEIARDDGYFTALRKGYGEGIGRLFDSLPDSQAGTG